MLQLNSVPLCTFKLGNDADPEKHALDTKILAACEENTFHRIRQATGDVTLMLHDNRLDGQQRTVTLQITERGQEQIRQYEEAYQNYTANVLNSLEPVVNDFKALGKRVEEAGEDSDKLDAIFRELMQIERGPLEKITQEAQPRLEALLASMQKMEE